MGRNDEAVMPPFGVRIIGPAGKYTTGAELWQYCRRTGFKTHQELKCVCAEISSGREENQYGIHVSLYSLSIHEHTLRTRQLDGSRWCQPPPSQAGANSDIGAAALSSNTKGKVLMYLVCTYIHLYSGLVLLFTSGKCPVL